MSSRRVLALFTILGMIASVLAMAVVSAEGVTKHLTVGKAVSGKPLVFSGSGPSHADAVLQRRDDGHWRKVASTHVGRNGRYVVSTPATLGHDRFRVLVADRPSRVVTVNPTPAVKPVGTGYVVSGRLPTSARRSVLLQRQVGDHWANVVGQEAARTFKLGWTPTATTTVRIAAPRAVRITGSRHHRVRIVLPAVASAPVRLSVVPDPTDPGTPDPTPTDPGTPDPTPTDPGTPDPTDPGTPDPGTPDPGTPMGPAPITYTDITAHQTLNSKQPRVSADGRYVAFLTYVALDATNDADNALDVYLHDRVLGTDELISKNATTGMAVGANDPAISADGRYVAFTTSSAVTASEPAVQTGAVYLYDRQAGTASAVSFPATGMPDGGSYGASVSAHGEYVAFTSVASNLGAADTNGTEDVYVRDMTAATTTLVSAQMADQTKAGDGASWGASINADGSRIAYVSTAQDLAANLSPGTAEIFLWEDGALQSVPISVHVDHGDVADGYCQQPSINASGTAVAFASYATNLGLTNPSHRQQVHLWREADNGTTPISAIDGAGGNWHSETPSISGDGQRIAFGTGATDLVPGITQGWSGVMVWDATSGLRTVSVDAQGNDIDGDSYFPSLDQTGHTLAFETAASGIVPGDGVQGWFHVVVAVLP